MQLQVGQRIRIVVNGEAAETGAATLAELVAELGYDGAKWRPHATATSCRGARAPETKLAAEDTIEIVAPRQGG